ncbi:hypothetical protein [Microvirga puerhi]|uniref:Uncharacterized protein n=1 Tax=Microvirga puerhi TaxID=2876078 RepID=A0ABS7VMP7_9HYPH|nr:hypothetical protein [Microvirga puerhi]MBZ6076805.1 hypothetical protein [Microvirga puerhi]
MTEDEVEIIAAELAKAGGHSWYPGRERGPFKVVADRYRDRARLAIAALDRYRAGKPYSSSDDAIEALPPVAANSAPLRGDELAVGSTVLYRPPGDKRFYQCRVEQLDGDRAYLVPDMKICTGWVDIKNLFANAEDISAGDT